MHDDNVGFGKIHAGIGLHQLRIVPLRDFAKEDSSQRFRSEVQSRGHSRHVIRRNVRSEDGGEVQHVHPALVLELLQLHRRSAAVAGAEIHGAGGHLLDAEAGAVGLIVDLHPRSSSCSR